MAILVLGLLLFLGVHSLLIVAPQSRESVIARRGRGAWLWPYIAASVLGLILIIWGYGLARQTAAIVYTPPLELRHLALLLMLPVFPLFAAANMPGRIKAAVGHPMLIGTVLWGMAHLLANGTLADLLLFGGFAGWAAIDWYSSVKRPRKPASTRAPSLTNDAIAVIVGLVIYALFLGGLHRLLFGVSPI